MFRLGGTPFKKIIVPLFGSIISFPSFVYPLKETLRRFCTKNALETTTVSNTNLNLNILRHFVQKRDFMYYLYKKYD